MLEWILRNKIKAFIYIFGPLILAWVFSIQYSIRINLSDSLPYKLFILDKGNKEVRKGKLIAFVAPGNGVYEGDFCKYVIGIPGDKVWYEGNDVYVGGKYIGKVKERSKKGNKLERGPEGIIPEGHYFVFSKKENSFDSRYKNIGYVKDSNIIGTVYPVF